MKAIIVIIVEEPEKEIWSNVRIAVETSKYCMNDAATIKQLRQQYLQGWRRRYRSHELREMH